MRRSGAAGTGAAQPRADRLDSVLAHELKLCASAVRLVAGGGAPRVWLVGMRSGRELIVRAVQMGNAADLLVRARWWPDEEALDLVVQQHG